MCKILVIYHSQTGNTQKMAESVARGVGSINDTEVILKRAGEATLQDLSVMDWLSDLPSILDIWRA